MRRTVSDAICSTLSAGGIEQVFGLPGTQTLDLWESLRKSELRTIVATSELGASFMAAGAARASGRPGALVTIGEPGFAFAFPGIVESLLDSVPVLHVASAARRVGPGPAGELRQSDVARLVYKAVYEPVEAREVPDMVDEALAATTEGEPGPVLVQLPSALLRTPVAGGDAVGAAPTAPDDSVVDRLAEELRKADRPLLFCGSGVAGASHHLVRLAEALNAPVVTTTSGRGVIAESHPLSVRHDTVSGDVEGLNELIRASDLVVVLGARLSDNGTRGGALVLPEDRVIRVDASSQVLGDRYPARLELVGDAEHVVRGLADGLERELGASMWSVVEIAKLKERLQVDALPTLAEPLLGGVRAKDFFARLRDVLPAETPVATDSGLHQYLVRAHFPVLAPRTLLVPANFQSMGFGIPTAIGAAVAVDGPAIAIVGDGGVNINGVELVTAVRERLPVTVIVLVDGQLGLIRAQQLRRTGRPTGVDINCPDLELFAQSLGADYLALPDGDPAPLRELVDGNKVTIVELPATETGAARRMQIRGRVAAAVRRA